MSLDCRPKLCLEKCDANTSIQSSIEQQEQTTASDKTVNDLPTRQNSNGIDLTKTDNSPQQLSETTVPKQYEHILRRPAFVKLIKYDNIEDLFRAPRSQTTQ